MLCLLRAYNQYNFLLLALFFLCFQANFPPSSSSSSTPQTHLCSEEEAAALIQFKTSFASNFNFYSYSCDEVGGVKSYPKTDSWKQGTDCCSWDGVTCDEKKGQVIGLDLSCSWLSGGFSPNSTLFHLRHLQKLNLAMNDFNYSKMPSKLGGFASLVELNLSLTHFGGQAPSQLSYLSKLVTLDLSWNYHLLLDRDTVERLVGNLTELRQLNLGTTNMSCVTPSALMNLSMTLSSLSLDHCDLRGNFPETIFLLPNLKYLNLEWNQNLNLKFPDQLNRSSSHLQHLDLSSNNFRGQIPPTLANLTKLQFLDLGDNQLEGSIPVPDDEVINNAFPNLIYLDLASNLLNGTLPSWLFTSSSLSYIDLSANQFSGEIKGFQSKSLEYLSLSYNQLTGQIKEFQSKSLETISLENNKFQGPIPFSISQLLNLTDLFLSSNNLSGVVEYDMLSKLQNLFYLDLSYNRLSFNSNPPIPSTSSSDYYTLPNLQYLFLASCNVTEFPQFLKGSEYLFYLDLSNNRIQGKIPKWMWNVGKDHLSYLNLSHNSLTKLVDQLPWTRIEALDLSSNAIHGRLPIPPSTTSVFQISDNRLSGEISSPICNATSLEILDLSNNSLTGVVPHCLGNFSNWLSMLNLAMNKLSGIIPPTFARDCQLSYLNLNGNQLQGPLPKSIQNCQSLQVLDVGNNKINGTFPHWLASLPNLQALVLKSNQFHGSIIGTRSRQHSFSKIQIFDLSGNHFSGPLPVRYIQNFKAMINLTKNASEESYMGAWSNGNGSTYRFYSYSIGIAIKGQEMELLKIFTMLTTIDLSNNKFRGEIPVVIGELNSLKGLNLSHNNLNGHIPSSIGDLVSVEWLDLSSNKLVGKIPESLLHLTSLSVLNLSKNQLQGQIPQGKQFNTFGNDSYQGNMGLCGFPVSKGCINNNEPPPSNLPQGNEGSNSNITFGWKVVAIGYGCGLVFGLAAGYVVFKTGKPKWFVTLVEEQQHRRRKKPKIGNHSGVRRRIYKSVPKFGP